MQQIVTASSAATNFYSPTSQEILSPLANQAKTSITLDWSQTRELANHTQERRQNKDIHAASSHQNPAAAPRKPSLSPSYMHQRTSSSDSQDYPRTIVGMTNNSRWRFNNAGQLVDSDITPAEWDLADEIGRLKIGMDVGDANDDMRGQMRTPPRSKMNAAAMAQVHEASPLETASDASVDSSSPHPSDQQLHSRGSSTDTTGSGSQTSVLSNTGHTLHVPSSKTEAAGETRERPHSYSGGLSTAELRRLQQAGASPVSAGDSLGGQQWQNINGKNPQAEQTMYPSLAAYPSISRPQQQQQQQSQSGGYDYRSNQMPGPRQDDPQFEYNTQRHNQPSNVDSGSMGPQPFPSRSSHNGPAAGASYRQPQRGFTPQMQGLLPSPTNFAYPGAQGPHVPHISLGNAQHMYEMMLQGGLPQEAHPAVTRVQQQHGVVRGAHQHSTSDPGGALRDPTALAVLSGNMQGFPGGGPPAPGMYPNAAAPTLPGVYANQFYPPQDMYQASQDLANAQALAARLQAQYTGSYGGVMPQGLPGMAQVDMTGSSADSGSSPNTNGPSANNRKLGLYKTELCRSWEEKGSCRYGAKCQFAHGEDEIRKVPRHPKYKTEICRTFWVSGSCPYGKRCCFIHTELPAGGLPPDAPPPPLSQGGGRDRSNSDPNDASTSLLARISAKRNQEEPMPMPMPQPNGMQMNGRPPTGSLRVDTSSLGASAGQKEHKSAYPTFPTNGGHFMPSQSQASAMSPAPVTAGPDFGRHNPRLELTGQAQARLPKSTTTINPNVRHSFNGTEMGLNLNTPITMSGHNTPYGISNADSGMGASGPTRVNGQGHMRSGSAGNWSSLPRSNHLAPAPYPGTPSVEFKTNQPWVTSEVSVGGGSRLTEQSWV